MPRGLNIVYHQWCTIEIDHLKIVKYRLALHYFPEIKGGLLYNNLVLFLGSIDVLC